MTTELVRTDVPDVFAAQMEMARVIADSSLLPGHLRKQPANVLLVLSGARALNIPAFWALQSIHVVDGKLGQSADLMRALVTRAGHKFRVIERSLDRAVVEILKSGDTEPYRAEFTREDAVTAGLWGKANWKTYPKAMLVARATAIAVRDHCPEVLFGMVYTPDELGAVTDADGAPEFDGNRVVLAPTPDKIRELADALGAAPARDFPAAWRAVVDLGWALERVPDTDESLVEYAQNYLAALAAVAVDQAAFMTIWDAAKDAGLIGITYADTGKPLGETLKQLAAELRERLAREAEAGPASADVVEGEVVGPAAEDIDTENAAALREQAAASWAEGKTDGESE